MRVFWEGYVRPIQKIYRNAYLPYQAGFPFNFLAKQLAKMIDVCSSSYVAHCAFLFDSHKKKSDYATGIRNYLTELKNTT